MLNLEKQIILKAITLLHEAKATKVMWECMYEINTL
jgi:hypothetical protein